MYAVQSVHKKRKKILGSDYVEAGRLSLWYGHFNNHWTRLI